MADVENFGSKFLDYLKYAISNIRKRRTRSWLTMIGIFIGIAAVVSLISLGQGMQAAINEQFQMMGADKIIISPGSSIFSSFGGSAKKLTDKDKDVVEKISGVNLAAAMVFKQAQIKFNGKTKYTIVSGLPTDKTIKIVEDMQSVKIDKGRNLKSSDKYKVVIGYRTGIDLFERDIKLGDKIEMEGKEFEVIGILERIGNKQDDSSVFIPLDTARELFNMGDEISTMIVQAKQGSEPSVVAEEIKKDLRKSRDEKKGDETFSVETSEQLIETFNTILNVIQYVLIGIAGISLFVGGVGIMNTMYTAVLERTREIGVMKAIGARNSDIMLIFLIESGTLGLVGGAIGIVLGIGLSKLVEFIAINVWGTTLLKASFPWYLILGALAFSFLVGSASGLLPARQASKMKPVDSLRYE
jgi:putative ABC transport system permease protein